MSFNQEAIQSMYMNHIRITHNDLFQHGIFHSRNIEELKLKYQQMLIFKQIEYYNYCVNQKRIRDKNQLKYMINNVHDFHNQVFHVETSMPIQTLNSRFARVQNQGVQDGNIDQNTLNLIRMIEHAKQQELSVYFQNSVYKISYYCQTVETFVRNMKTLHDHEKRRISLNDEQLDKLLSQNKFFVSDLNYNLGEGYFTFIPDENKHKITISSRMLLNNTAPYANSLKIRSMCNSNHKIFKTRKGHVIKAHHYHPYIVLKSFQFIEIHSYFIINCNRAEQNINFANYCITEWQANFFRTLNNACVADLLKFGIDFDIKILQYASEQILKLREIIASQEGSLNGHAK